MRNSTGVSTEYSGVSSGYSGVSSGYPGVSTGYSGVSLGYPAIQKNIYIACQTLNHALAVLYCHTMLSDIIIIIPAYINIFPCHPRNIVYSVLEDNHALSNYA